MKYNQIYHDNHLVFQGTAHQCNKFQLSLLTNYYEVLTAKELNDMLNHYVPACEVNYET